VSVSTRRERKGSPRGTVQIASAIWSLAPAGLDRSPSAARRCHWRPAPTPPSRRAATGRRSCRDVSRSIASAMTRRVRCRTGPRPPSPSRRSATSVDAPGLQGRASDARRSQAGVPGAGRRPGSMTFPEPPRYRARELAATRVWLAKARRVRASGTTQHPNAQVMNDAATPSSQPAVITRLRRDPDRGHDPP
jgi:hypothetical protein